MAGPRAGKRIIRALLLGAFLLAAMRLCACAQKAKPAMAQPVPTASPAAGPTVPPGSTPMDRLCACVWVDAYDKNFILTFDKMGGEMTERNDPAGIKRTNRIAVEEEAILLYDDLGLLLASLPYTLQEDSLRIDYGETLGVLEYRAAR